MRQGAPDPEPHHGPWATWPSRPCYHALHRPRGTRPAHGACTLLTSLLAIVAWVPPSDAGGDWSAVAESRVTYTDNVFAFSAARRQRLSEDPSQPTVVGPEKKADVVWDPSLEVIRASSSRATVLSFKAHGFLYTDNPVFNHGDYRLQVRQTVTPRTTVLLRYRYVPNLFLGPNFERRTGSQLIEDERVTSHGFRMELERRVGERWVIGLIGRGGLRFYNDPFAERDTRFYSAGPALSYEVGSLAVLSLGYLYERGLADGAGDIRFNDDISYRLHVVSTVADVRLSERFSLHLLYLYRRKDFTSDLVGDTHLERHDDTHQGTAELRYHMTAATRLSMGFQRLQRTSTAALRSFQDNQLWLGAQHLF